MSADEPQHGELSPELAAQYKRDCTLLRSVIGIISRSQELNQALDQILDSVLRILGPGVMGRVLLINGSSQELYVVAQRGVSSVELRPRFFVDECPCASVVKSGMPMSIPYCSREGCRSGTISSPPHSHLNIPLFVWQEVVGMICLICPPGFTVQISELSVWEDLGRLIGKVFEQSNLYHHLHQQRDLLHALYDISEELATSLDLDWVLSRVLRVSISATNAQDGSIFLLPTAEMLGPRILRRDLPPADADRVVREVISRGLAGWVVRHKRGAIVSDTGRDPRWLAFADEAAPPGSALAVPLVADDRVLGVLTLTHPQVAHFQDHHLVLMVAIAHQASVAIEKARLHKEVARWAEELERRVEKRTRELHETQARLLHAEKLAELGQLAAGIAHEINNPLHVLQACTEYMSSQLPAGDPLLELLEPMQNSLQNIAYLATQLRDFSRPASSERKRVDINQVLSQVLRLANKELMRNQVTVVEHFSPVPPITIADARQLEQVFLNLILNARDAMPQGGQLTIETSVGSTTISVQFRDTGVGIATENLDRVFEPYFTTKSEGGTGLGLAICQQIIAQHEGQIRVTSELGRGTVFTVQLPAAPIGPES